MAAQIQRALPSGRAGLVLLAFGVSENGASRTRNCPGVKLLNVFAMKENVFMAAILSETANSLWCCFFAIAKMRHCFILDRATPRTRDGSL
jgi:hypothetical protein